MAFEIYINNVRYTAQVISFKWRRELNEITEANIQLTNAPQSDTNIQPNVDMYITEHGLKKFRGKVREVEYISNKEAIIKCKTYVQNIADRKHINSGVYIQQWVAQPSSTIVANLISSTNLTAGVIDNWGSHDATAQNDTVYNCIKKEESVTGYDWYSSDQAGGAEE